MELVKEDWLSDEHKALVLYYTLLYIRFNYIYNNEKIDDKLKQMLRKNIASYLFKKFRLKRETFADAMGVVDEFIQDSLMKTPNDLNERKKILEDLELKYYNIFKKNLYKIYNK